MEEEREVCTGLHKGETTPSQLHEARYAGSPSYLSSRCTKDGNLTPVLNISSLVAGFPSCCPKVVTKLSQSCPLSIFLISPPMLQAFFLVRPLLVLVLLRDILGRLLAGPCVFVYLSTCVVVYSSTCLLVSLCTFLLEYLSPCLLV